MCIRHCRVWPVMIFAICSKLAYGSGILVDSLVQHWEKSRDLALTMAKAMPEGLYSNTAAGQEHTSAGQLNGVALTNVLACAMALHTRAPQRFQSAFDKPMDSSKAGVIENLTEAFSFCVDGLKSMADADVLQPAAYKGRLTTKFDIFWDAYAHGTFMLGQAATFMRARGVEPPDTGPRYDF